MLLGSPADVLGIRKTPADPGNLEGFTPPPLTAPYPRSLTLPGSSPSPRLLCSEPVQAEEHGSALSLPMAAS